MWFNYDEYISVMREKIARKYSERFANKLHDRQVVAIYHRVVDSEKKQKFYKDSQLSLFV